MDPLDRPDSESQSYNFNPDSDSSPTPDFNELSEPLLTRKVSLPQPFYKISSAEPSDLSELTPSALQEIEIVAIDEESDDTSSGDWWRVALSVAREVGETIVLTLIIFLLIQTVIRNFRVVGTSMMDNLQDGQYLIIDKVSYSYLFSEIFEIGGPQRGDVVVFEPPNHPEDDYVKRIIGLPGETVEIKNGQILINNEVLEEPFHPRPLSYTKPPQLIPEGQVFVLGDNRNNSNDSHNWGPLPIENIVGRAWLSYWPPEYWGVIPRDAPTEEATLKYLFSNMVPGANAEENKQ